LPAGAVHTRAGRAFHVAVRYDPGMADLPESLLAWQWSIYPAGHRDRRNLLVHVLTVPVFELGTVAVIVSPFLGLWLAPAGLVAMVGVMALQGRTHRLEAVPPAPFRGLGNVLGRVFGEQWLTFPRYVLAGGFACAWREAGSPAARTPSSPA